MVPHCFQSQTMLKFSMLSILNIVYWHLVPNHLIPMNEDAHACDDVTTSNRHFGYTSAKSDSILLILRKHVFKISSKLLMHSKDKELCCFDMQ